MLIDQQDSEQKVSEDSGESIDVLVTTAYNAINSFLGYAFFVAVYFFVKFIAYIAVTITCVMYMFRS